MFLMALWADLLRLIRLLSLNSAAVQGESVEFLE
jgi:hypothetical protein